MVPPHRFVGERFKVAIAFLLLFVEILGLQQTHAVFRLAAKETQRVKASGEHWVVQEKKGRKMLSRGVWAAAGTIERIRAELEIERSTESYAKRKEADAKRRDKAQEI